MITDFATVNLLPQQQILQRLTGDNLELVSYGRYVIHLSFESGNKLSFSAPFRFGGLNALSDCSVVEFPLDESKLVRLLGFQVSHVGCDTDGTLELRFSNNDVLIVYANDPAYEAYTLSIDGKEFIV